MNNPIKIIHYKKELAQFRKGERVFPRKIQIDPVSYCNHDCQFCMYRYTRDEDINALFNVKDILSTPKMMEILEDCADLGVKAIELTGGGEPSLHPEFPLILEKVNRLGMDIGLVTNGAWREKHFTAMVDTLKDAEWVRFSLDASTPETHKITHSAKNGDFEKACLAIEALSDTPITVGISFVVQKQNMHEIKDIVKLAEHYKADYVRFAGVIFEAGRIDEIELTYKEHFETAETIRNLMHNKKIKIYDEFSDRSQSLFPQYNKGDTCYYAHLSTVIGADAKLYPCCIWKYRPDGVIADLNETRLKDAWNNGMLDNLFENLDISEKCVRCHIKPKNDFIHLMVTDNQIQHVNFI